MSFVVIRSISQSCSFNFTNIKIDVLGNFEIERKWLYIYIHYIWKWLVKRNVRNNSSPQLICFWICKYFAIKSLVQGRWKIGVDRAEENPARSHNSRSNFYYATEIELLFALQAVRLIRLAPATWHFLLSRLLFLLLFYPLVSRK